MNRMWYQYNIEPIAGWKAFRTASMLWQTYHLRCREGSIARSEQEESNYHDAFHLVSARELT